MKARSYLLLLALLASGASSGAAQPAEMPRVIEPKVERKSGPAFWVSAEAAMNRGTVLDWSLVGEDGSLLVQIVERQGKALAERGRGKVSNQEIQWLPASECTESILLTPHHGGEGPSGTFRDLREQSQSIWKGRIAAIEPGFFSGAPAALLRVEVLDVVRESKSSPRKQAFVQHPVARFKIGDYRFCSGYSGFEPKVGDRILVFDYAGPIGRGDLLFAPRMEQTFFETAEGDLFLPESLRQDDDLWTAKNLEDVISLTGMPSSPTF
ncbi:MAG TPA: hypothetical protein VF179_07325 [Thermoanaerobaculia bacterium]|nr:hypothetical protein [Thermoanaerobaculia bacterium]